ncbi:unnamed protein product [Parnassius apollo]|uniref:(apollo) hypothetical protein n=1 Tax=Parnassius apollo TaxID=110799 RepID=A0A8S3WVM5_PARAO|nr:unnamed protein product [Parnassius apollo]
MTSGRCKRAYKELRSHKTWIPSLLENSIPSTNRENILKIATKFYAKLYDQKDLRNFEAIKFYSQNQTIIDWTETEIDREIKRLKSDQSPRPDGVLNKALKLARTVLTPVITYLFNVMNKEREFPSIGLNQVLYYSIRMIEILGIIDPSVYYIAFTNFSHSVF